MSTSNPPPTSTLQPITTQPQTYTHTAILPPHNTIPPTDENISRLINAIVNAFHSTPLFLTFVTELDAVPPTTVSRDIITPTRRHNYYADGITRLARAKDIILVESGDFSAVAIWEPPSFSAPDFSSSRKEWSPSQREWTKQVKRARVRFLGVDEDVGANPPEGDIDELTTIRLRPFWHLGFLARDPDVEKVPGAISSVVVPYLARAREDRVPAWLEATTVYAVGLYESLGFRLVSTVTVGAGRYGEDGWFEEGGKGTSGYCMIYDGHLTEGGKQMG